MYCNTCGAFVEDTGAHFCQSCGAPLEAPQQPENAGYEQNNSYDNNGNGYYQGGYDYQQNNAYQPGGYDMNADGYNNAEGMNGDVQETNNKKKTIIVAVSAVVTVALICAAVLASIFITSGKKGEKGFDELKEGVRAQVISDVPESDFIEMRDQPSDEAEMIIKVYEKEYVDILADYNSENDGYVFARHLEDNEYKDGWLPAEYLTKVSMSDEYKNLKEGARCRVVSDSEKGDGLSLYSKASLDSDVILNIPEGEHVVLLEDYNKKNGEFIFVEYVYESKEHEGWILGQYAYFDGWAKDFELQEETTEETEPTNPDRPELSRGAVCVIMNNTPYHDGVTMRSQASYNSGKVRVIAENQYVYIVSDYDPDDNGYVQCYYDDLYDGYSGWISAKFLAYVTYWNGNPNLYLNAVDGYDVPTTEESTTFYEGGPGSDAYKSFDEGDYCYIGYETVGHDGLNFRTGPSSSSGLIAVLEEGTDATVVKDYSSSDNGYVKVEVNGVVGYLIGKYLIYSGTSNSYVPDEIQTESDTEQEDDENYFYVEESESETETQAEVITESDEIEVEIEDTETEVPSTQAPTTTEATTTRATTTTQAPTTTTEPEVEVVVGPDGQHEEEIVVDIE